MAKKPLILAIDQGTTSSRAIVFDLAGRAKAVAQTEFPQIYPRPGWVEHDVEDIWRTTLDVSRRALAQAESQGGRVAAIGITNQRETTVIWDRKSGRPIHNAIVWQDRRTADHCARLKDEGAEAMVTARAGLLLDPYFSATKIAWLLDHVKGGRRRAEAGELAFGTIDSFLLWRLTGGHHATDATNAARTALFDIHRQRWDPELLELFGVPETLLPEVCDCAAPFGPTKPDLFGRPIPVTGIAGDQQAALIGQACFDEGLVKATFGTGCFMLVNTGARAVASEARLLTTVGYRLDGRCTYALEGSIFVAGAAVKWLRDRLGIISEAAETQALARGLASNAGVYLVPAFAGLGAPYWRAEARAAITGMTLDTGIAEVVRAALESVCYQSHDLLDAMVRDIGSRPTTIRVDGGMAVNDWLMQFLADILDIPVDRPSNPETTAQGAAYLAGLEAGLYGALAEIATVRQAAERFAPAMADEQRGRLLDGWHRAVAGVLAT